MIHIIKFVYRIEEGKTLTTNLFDWNLFCEGPLRWGYTLSFTRMTRVAVDHKQGKKGQEGDYYEIDRLLPTSSHLHPKKHS